MIKEKVAVVTGGNRGIGFEICKQLAREGILVVMGSRDKKKGLAACDQLQREELPVRFYELDVDHAASIAAFSEFVKKEFGRCDILVNNAGIFPDAPSGNASGNDVGSVLHVKIETINKALRTNTYGPLLMSQAFVPLMQKNHYGRIVNMSSGLGQLTEMGGSYPAYRISKTAINALTRMFSDELKGENILVNSMSPGWIKTDMGGPDAPLSVEEGADTAVWLATLPNVWSDRKIFPRAERNFMVTKDYYALLEVNPDASSIQIRRAYRKMALRWHPDRVSVEKKASAEEKFKEIAEAYYVLGEKERRKIYDQQRKTEPEFSLSSLYKDPTGRNVLDEFLKEQQINTRNRLQDPDWGEILGGFKAKLVAFVIVIFCLAKLQGHWPPWTAYSFWLCFALFICAALYVFIEPLRYAEEGGLFICWLMFLAFIVCLLFPVLFFDLFHFIFHNRSRY